MEAEHAVLDGIPFGGAGWEVKHTDVQAEALTERDLNLVFPETGAVAIAASAVCEDEQVTGVGILHGSDL